MDRARNLWLFEKETGARIHVEYAKLFIAYCMNPHRIACYNSGFVELPRDRMEEVFMRIEGARNWILKLAEETQNKDDDRTLLFQFDLNLFPLVRTEPVAKK